MNPSNITIEEPFYVSGETYEVTLNPKKQHFNTGNRLKLCIKDLDVLLIELSTVADVVLYPEISEIRHSNPDLKSEPRLHFHGTLSLDKADTSAGLFMLLYVSKIKQYGDFQFNLTVGDGHGYDHREDYWTAYCTKQRSVIEPIFKKYKIPYIQKSLEDPSFMRLAKLEQNRKTHPAK